MDKGVKEYLKEVMKELKQGKYHPKPVLRVNIPKPDGRMRPLGIPTVKDRIVQQACKIVIEPIFEARFTKHSYGYRPKKNAHMAIRAIKQSMVRSWYVVDMDIKSYFENIDHGLLIKLVKKCISDRRVIKLITKWLKSGVYEIGYGYVINDDLKAIKEEGFDAVKSRGNQYYAWQRKQK